MKTVVNLNNRRGSNQNIMSLLLLIQDGGEMGCLRAEELALSGRIKITNALDYQKLLKASGYSEDAFREGTG